MHRRSIVPLILSVVVLIPVTFAIEATPIPVHEGFPPPGGDGAETLPAYLQSPPDTPIAAGPPRAQDDSSSGLSRMQADEPPVPADLALAREALQSAPLMFIENVGQFDEGARFQVRGGNGALWLAENALWITVVEPGSEGVERRGPEQQPVRATAPESRKGVNLRLSFVGADPSPRLEPFNRVETSVNYFLGDDPEEWRSNVPVWGGVRYVDLYPGIDLVVGAGLASTQGQPQELPLPWRLEVRDAADLSAVRLRAEGVDALALDGNALRLATAVGDLLLPLLAVDGAAPDDQSGASGANLTETLDVGRGAFEVCMPFRPPLLQLVQPQHPLSLQDTPSDLLYSTFLGGSAMDYGMGLAVDEGGNAYVTGGTKSSNFPSTAGAFDADLDGPDDAFLVKVNASGTGLVYAMFLGGSGYERGSDVAIDRMGHAYVTGYTGSSNFPTTEGAFDSSHNGGADAFVVKVNAGGTDLVYAAFLGGSAADEGWTIAVDGAGSIYVAGDTRSSDFPATAGASDTDHNGGLTDAFVAKINGSGTDLIYATFLGGGGNERGSAITVDEAGSAYVGGNTSSADFPTTGGAFDTSHNGYDDAFIVKVNPNGNGLSYSTFLGGGGSDGLYDYSLAIDEMGSVYVGSRTSSSDFPVTEGAFDTTYNGDYDPFVAKMNAEGTDLLYATFLGGSANDHVDAIAVDGAGSAYVAGHTISSDFPITVGAFDPTYNGAQDVFLARVNSGGTELDYATFLGGSKIEYGRAIAFDGVGNAYVSGQTDSLDFPTTLGAFDTSHNHSGDVFVVKMAVGGAFLDLPVSYSNFAQSAVGNTGVNPGRVNCWFDHTSPYSHDEDITRWDGNWYSGAGLDSCDLGVSCYDGHNGIDFQHDYSQANEPIFSAAPGIAHEVCVRPDPVNCQRSASYGNYVLIDHENSYATLYAHLATVTTTINSTITHPVSQSLGVMGGSGGYAVHLHFSLYRDQNGDGQWTADEVVDPYGWAGEGDDPWSPSSHYLWKHPLWGQDTADNSGGSVSSPSGNAHVAIPPGTLTSTITVELWDVPPVAEPSAHLRSAGQSFWLRVLQWLSGGSVGLNEDTSSMGFSQPITVTATYTDANVLHLDPSQLAMYRWDESSATWSALTTTVNITQPQAIAHTLEIGRFDLQAPLLCPSDTLEPDDNYDSATTISADGMVVSRLFDIAGDEDWHRLDAVAGSAYALETTSLATGVDTVIELHDLSAVSLLASDDNSGDGQASYLEWQAPLDGAYYIRVAQASGSAFGCESSYEFNVQQLQPAPAVAITGQTTGIVASTCAFTATVSPITVPQPITYTWHATSQSPVTATDGLSNTVGFSWMVAGPQTITVTALSAAGRITGTHTITIHEPVQAGFDASPVDGVAPLTVVFTNTSTGDYSASLWSFGDSMTSTLENPTHFYAAAGAYTVALTVSGPGGSDKETKAAYVTVTEDYAVYLPLILRQP